MPKQTKYHFESNPTEATVIHKTLPITGKIKMDNAAYVDYQFTSEIGTPFNDIKINIPGYFFRAVDLDELIAMLTDMKEALNVSRDSQ